MLNNAQTFFLALFGIESKPYIHAFMTLDFFFSEYLKPSALHSAFIESYFLPKGTEQGGSARADLMGCRIAICHGGHLDTYK